jgi:hypothetical protein
MEGERFFLPQVVTEEDCRGSRVMWELKMIEKNEVALREKQM